MGDFNIDDFRNGFKKSKSTSTPGLDEAIEKVKQLNKQLNKN